MVRLGIRSRFYAPLAASVLLVLAGPIGVAHARTDGAVAPRAGLAERVLVAVNALRARHHLSALKLSRGLTAAADAHGREMAERGYFEHESADGSAFWKRIERFYPSRGRRTWTVGENLLWSSPDVDAADTVEAWLASPPHRRILLAPAWREIGISAVGSDEAPGVYGGEPVTIVTADFGARG
jgi:uncharacterized protein YkwD